MFENIKTTCEAAQMLKMTQRNVADLCSRGKITGATKKGKTWLIPELSINVYIIQHGNKKLQKEVPQS